MKLWYSPASPFVRKALIVAAEKGLSDRIERIDANTSAVAPNMALLKDNPTGKIPAMRLDDGSVIFDSAVICTYLDELDGKPIFLPESGPRRYRIMTLEALGDGIMEAAVLARYETALRPAQYQWSDWRDGQMRKVNTALDDMEANWQAELGGDLNMGAISVAFALGYLDYRYVDLGWRDARPKLAAWFAAFAQRPSFAGSNPHV